MAEGKQKESYEIKLVLEQTTLLSSHAVCSSFPALKFFIVIACFFFSYSKFLLPGKQLLSRFLKEL